MQKGSIGVYLQVMNFYKKRTGRGTGKVSGKMVFLFLRVVTAALDAGWKSGWLKQLFLLLEK